MARARTSARAKKPLLLPRRKPAAKKLSLATIDARLDRIEKLLLDDVTTQAKVEQEESEELDELKRIEELETAIQQDLKQHPLTKITYHDITKGMIGSFFGVVGHFAFFKGPDLASHLTTMRATVLLITSMILLVVFLYFSGFRRVTEYHSFLPLRFLVIYVTALIVATGVLFLFDVLTFPIDWHLLYTNVAALSILAVMGAATADLIGGEA